MHDVNMCIKQFFFSIFLIISKFNDGEWIHIHITFINDDVVKNVVVWSNSNSKAQNILSMKCDVKRWFL